jgi:malate dehydrogenase (quinone)
MISLIQKCFPQQAASPEWQARFREMIPTFGQSLADNAELMEQTRNHTSAVLELSVDAPLGSK